MLGLEKNPEGRYIFPLNVKKGFAMARRLRRIRVWDLPARLFHGLLVLDVIGLFITAYQGALDWHMRLGCAMLVLLLFRLCWGIFGGHWSRFASFCYSPRQLLAWLRGSTDPALAGLGHKPFGALSVWAMLSVLLLQVGSGLMSDDEIAYASPWARHVSETVVSWMTNYHAAIGQWLLLALVLLHVAAILFYLLVKKENLIGPMLHGDKVTPQSADASPVPARDDARSRWLALGLLLGCVALTAWLTGFAA